MASSVPVADTRAVEETLHWRSSKGEPCTTEAYGEDVQREALNETRSSGRGSTKNPHDFQNTYRPEFPMISPTYYYDFH